jgi:hypothetical protein
MTDYRDEAVAVALSTIEPQWKHAIRVWWSWQWRTFIATFLLTTFANFWLRILGGSVGMNARGFALTVQIVDLAIAGVVGLAFFRDVLDREYETFRVCLIPKSFR